MQRLGERQMCCPQRVREVKSQTTSCVTSFSYGSAILTHSTQMCLGALLYAILSLITTATLSHPQLVLSVAQDRAQRLQATAPGNTAESKPKRPKQHLGTWFVRPKERLLVPVAPHPFP